MYLVDALPREGKVELLLSGFRRVSVKTTFPVYLEELPSSVFSHPSVVGVEEETWMDLDGRERTIYRVELRDYPAYYQFRRALKVVNDFISPLNQALERLGLRPFSRVEVSGDGRVTAKEEPGFPEVNYAKVVLYDWYGEYRRGRYYRLYYNGVLKEEGDVRDLRVEADVVEAPSTVKDRVKAIVLVESERRKSPVDVKGLIIWSKSVRVLLRDIMYATIGKALTTNEAWVALKKKYVIPRVNPRVEELRDLEELAYADKGGLILFPELKCVDKAFQVDFSSMYPSIISKYNISGETVDRCGDLDLEIHTVCTKERGIVAEAVERLIKLKEFYKAYDEELAEAIKWILVASFDYLGYRNSLFGKIEAYELVTFMARKVLRKAVELAESKGLKVVGGIVDSLVVQGERGKVEEFVKEVSEATGLKLKLEEEFDWVIFTRSSDGLPYPQRYIGRRGDGTLKVKGLIRSNQPKIVQDFYRASLEVMAKAESCEELKGLRKAVEDVYYTFRRRAYYGEPSDFVLWVRDEPYVRGARGFYRADEGYSGHDVDYYLDYLRRAYETVEAMLP
ncbi:MAG: DNA polymerase domain-containing protein [Thermoprotei archaeon]